LAGNRNFLFGSDSHHAEGRACGTRIRATHPKSGTIYEYACHEGNYAMPDIMGGARKMDAEGRENISRH
jgi:hypothetical protein